MKQQMTQGFSFDYIRALQLILYMRARRIDCYKLCEASFEPIDCVVAGEIFQKITFDFVHCVNICSLATAD